jgi:hypothetical protein
MAADTNPDDDMLAALQDDLLLKLHDQSMDADPVEASLGRGMKLLVPALMQWLEEEIDRGTKPSVMAVNAGRAGIDLFFMAVYGLVPTAKQVSTAEGSRDHWLGIYDSRVAKLRALAKATQP